MEEIITIVKRLSRDFPLGLWSGHYHYLQVQERCVGGDGYYAIVIKVVALDGCTTYNEEVFIEGTAKEQVLIAKLVAKTIRFEHKNIEATVTLSNEAAQKALESTRKLCADLGYKACEGSWTDAQLSEMKALGFKITKEA